MRQIADVDGIEQPGGSFLHQRTHTLDPLLPVRLTWPQGPLLKLKLPLAPISTPLLEQYRCPLRDTKQ